jgi:hypothetical protein
MTVQASDIFTGVLMAVLGLIGLLLASGAHDDEMYVFGLSLAGFAAVFVLGLIRRHYDRADAARAAVPVQERDHV